MELYSVILAKLFILYFIFVGGRSQTPLFLYLYNGAGNIFHPPNSYIDYIKSFFFLSTLTSLLLLFVRKEDEGVDLTVHFQHFMYSFIQQVCIACVQRACSQRC